MICRRYADVTDGTEYPQVRWLNVQFPRIQAAVARAVRSVTWLHTSKSDVEGAAGHRAHFGRHLSLGSNPVPAPLLPCEGRLSLMGACRC